VPTNFFRSPIALNVARVAVCLAMMLSWTQPLLADEVAASTTEAKSLTMVVMDPLAAPLACDCVKGYANRQYQRLAEALEAKLKRKVVVFWSESLVGLHKKDAKLVPDLVIGKYSVVETHGKQLDLKLRPFASLTDTDGKVAQRGLFVVRSDSAAASLVDLEGATIFYGPEDCAEKWSSPRELLDTLGIVDASDSKTFQSCSEAAKALLALSKDVNASAVISSYAAPLLEGCGTIKKGDLRVIGQTEDLPFVTAFVNTSLSAEQQSAIEAAVLEQRDPELLKVLESAEGFRAYSTKP
jgi:ABC-type phosphate/phosphonate transport system substrate-binding protein